MPKLPQSEAEFSLGIIQKYWPCFIGEQVARAGSGLRWPGFAGSHSLFSTLNTFPFLPDLELFWSISEWQKPLRQLHTFTEKPFCSG